jgi:23S rRNA pseudouridine2605 synthase
VFAALPPELGRLLSVGRLDINSEGLLLLTNDGALKRRLELPASGWTRRYRVRVHGRPDPKKLAGLARGLRVDGVDYGPIRAELERQTGANAWLKMALTEGKNREVRKVLEHLGLAVNRLIRVAYGPFQLGRLPRRAIEEVPAKVLAEQLGEAGERKIGTAKAKPRPVRPGGKKPGGKRAGGKRADAGKGKRRAGTAGKDAAKHAHRRRPS